MLHLLGLVLGQTTSHIHTMYAPAPPPRFASIFVVVALLLSDNEEFILVKDIFIDIRQIADAEYREIYKTTAERVNIARTVTAMLISMRYGRQTRRNNVEQTTPNYGRQTRRKNVEQTTLTILATLCIPISSRPGETTWNRQP